MSKILPPVFLLFLLCTISEAVAESVQRLESADLVMLIEKIEIEQNGGIRLVSLTDKATEHLFCSAPARPLFSLILCDPKATKQQHHALADSGWDSVAVNKEGSVLYLSWKGYQKFPGAENVSVTMQIVADPAKNGIEISQTAIAGSEQVSIVAMMLGQIAVRSFGPDTK